MFINLKVLRKTEENEENNTEDKLNELGIEVENDEENEQGELTRNREFVTMTFSVKFIICIHDYGSGSILMTANGPYLAKLTREEIVNKIENKINMGI